MPIDFREPENPVNAEVATLYFPLADTTQRYLSYI